MSPSFIFNTNTKEIIFMSRNLEYILFTFCNIVLVMIFKYLDYLKNIIRERERERETETETETETEREAS